VAVAYRAAELELINNVSLCVAHVVNRYVVENIVAELEVVGAAHRLLEGIVAGDDRDRVGLVGACEDVEVGAVSRWVAGDEWSFAVAGGVGPAGAKAEDGNAEQHQQRSHDAKYPCSFHS